MTFSGIYTSTNGQASGGNNMADFVLGYPSNLLESMSQHNNVQVAIPALYVNDTWRVNRRVTMTYGLRWEPYLAVKDFNGFNMAFRRNLFEQGFRSTVYDNAPPGVLYRGDPGFPTTEPTRRASWRSSRRASGSSGIRGATTARRFAPALGLYFNAPQTWRYSLMPIAPPWGNSSNAVHAGAPGATLATAPASRWRATAVRSTSLIRGTPRRAATR